MEEQPSAFAPKPKRKILGITVTKKKVIWTIIILLVLGGIGYRIFKPKNFAANIQSDVVRREDLKRTVLATGQVVSETNLSLSFKGSGVIQKIYVKEGDKVKTGDVLATLDQKDQLASLTTARGSLAAAQANYQKVLAGSSNEDIQVAQVALDNAQQVLDTTKQQQNVLVNNALNTLLNSTIAAVADKNNPDSVVPTITGTYNSTDQGIYQIAVFNGGGGMRFQANGLETADNLISTAPQALGKRGLFLQFSGTPSIFDRWTITIPNTLASTYVSNYNAYQAAIQTRDVAIANAQAAVNSAQAALDLKKAQARPADVAAAQAQITSAEGQVQAAQANLENTIIRAPAAGTITSVDKKVGEQATAMQEVVVLQDVGNLHVEADVSEANIADLRPGQTADLTFSSLGPDRHFNGTVQTINPASTLSGGVVNYKVTISLPNISEIMPGMSADITVLTAQKSGVLAISGGAIINRDNKKYVRVIDDTKKKTYHEVEVQTGLEADGGKIEVMNGLNEGQEVVTFIKQ